MLKTLLYSLLIITLLVVFPLITDARRGCCSHHGGVCGCRCCDGTPLSAKCAPYYPDCNSRLKKPAPKPPEPRLPEPKPTTPPESTHEQSETSETSAAIEENISESFPIWLLGRIGSFMRWAIGVLKSLPSNFGYFAFGFIVASLIYLLFRRKNEP